MYHVFSLNYSNSGACSLVRRWVFLVFMVLEKSWKSPEFWFSHLSGNPASNQDQVAMSQEAKTTINTHTHAHTDNHFMALLDFVRDTRVSQHQKGKTNLDLLAQEIVSGSGISWAICKSAPWSRHITMPASLHSVFYRTDAPSCPILHTFFHPIIVFSSQHMLIPSQPVLL